MAPAKVCLVTVGNFLQEDRRAQKQARSLLERGHAVDVVFPERRYGIPEQRLDHPRLRLCPVRVRSPHSSRSGLGALANLLLFQGRALPAFFMAALRSQADCYLLHNVHSLGIGGLAAMLRGRPYLYDCRDLWREVKVAGSGASLGGLWGAVERVFIRRARRVFVVCDFHADYLRDAYGIPRPTVMHNCPPRWDPSPDDVLRRRYSIPPDHLVAIHTGALQEGVGIDRLIEAADHLDPGITVVILGFFQRDAFRESVRAAIARRPNIVLAEPVAQDEMPRYLVGADVGVVLYLAAYKANQSLPNKLFEYMMCGLALVTNGYRDTRTVVEGARAGFALEPCTSATLATVLNRLRREPQLLAEMKRCAREAAVNRYTWELESQKLLDALQEAGA